MLDHAVMEAFGAAGTDREAKAEVERGIDSLGAGFKRGGEKERELMFAVGGADEHSRSLEDLMQAVAVEGFSHGYVKGSA